LVINVAIEEIVEEIKSLVYQFLETRKLSLSEEKQTV